MDGCFRDIPEQLHGAYGAATVIDLNGSDSQQMVGAATVGPDFCGTWASVSIDPHAKMDNLAAETNIFTAGFVLHTL